MSNVISNLSQYPQDKNFSGLYEVHWDDGTPRYRGLFLENRTRVGQHIEFWANGNVRELSYWVDGTICGTAISFHENGMRETVIDYPEVGAKQKSWLSREFGERTGELISVDKCSADATQNLWTIQRIKDAMQGVDFDAIADEAVQQFLDATSGIEEQE